jgi:hypothetical protein
MLPLSVHSFETLVSSYQNTRCHYLECHSMNCHSLENVGSCTAHSGSFPYFSKSITYCYPFIRHHIIVAAEIFTSRSKLCREYMPHLLHYSRLCILSVDCVYGSHRILKIYSNCLSLNGINCFVLVMELRRVFSKEKGAFLNII